MSIRRTTLFGIAPLAAAALAAWWLSGALRGPAEVRSAAGPDWYFEDARLSAAGADGRLQYRISAPHITHDPADDAAVLDEPRMEWLQGGGPPLVISAQGGRAHADAQRVVLGGGVAIVDASTGVRVEFRTPRLTVDAVSRVAMTDEEILVFSPRGELRGVGLTVDMNRGILRVESAVRGRYVP